MNSPYPYPTLGRWLGFREMTDEGSGLCQLFWWMEMWQESGRYPADSSSSPSQIIQALTQTVKEAQEASEASRKEALRRTRSGPW